MAFFLPIYTSLKSFLIVFNLVCFRAELKAESKRLKMELSASRQKTKDSASVEPVKVDKKIGKKLYFSANETDVCDFGLLIKFIL